MLAGDSVRAIRRPIHVTSGMPVSGRCPGRPELCYVLVGRSRDPATTIAIWPVAVTTRTKVPGLPWQMHDSGESGIATPGAPGHHMISGPTARSAVPARTNLFICPKAKPCAIMSASVAVVRCGQQFERATAVGPGAVAQMANRGECGIGEREHARVYPNGAFGWRRPGKARRTRVWWW